MDKRKQFVAGTRGSELLGALPQFSQVTLEMLLILSKAIFKMYKIKINFTFYYSSCSYRFLGFGWLKQYFIIK